jgi:hypothetical protein
MTLAEARELAIQEELADLKARRSKDLLLALGLTAIASILLALALRDAAGWTSIPLFRQGRFLRDTFGLAGGVLVVRLFLGAVTILCWFWLIRVVVDLRGGLPRQRAKITHRLLLLERRSRGLDA